MRKWVPLFALAGAVLAFMVLRWMPVTSAERSGQPLLKEQNVSDEELKTFARAYVEVQRIRRHYEGVLRDVRDPEKTQALQQEANSKINEALKKEGFDVWSYNRIFNAVSSDEQLREKALDLINKERKQPGSLRRRPTTQVG